MTPEQVSAIRKQLEERVPRAATQGGRKVELEVAAGNEVASVIAQ